MSAPDVSVLVPVLNEGRFIRETAQAMLAQRFDGEVELLFVDGASDDDTRAILLELAASEPRIRVLDNPGRKTPLGLNVALAAASGEYVARMDAHAWYPPDYLALGVARLRRGDADWVAGPAVPRPGSGWSRRVAIALASPFGQGGSRKWREGTEADTESEEFDLDTGVFAGVWRRELLERYRGWDPDWHANQDAELAARFLADGRRIVCLPAMAAEYAPRERLSGLARQYFRFGWYRAKTARRHPDSLRPQHLVAVGLTLTAAAGALGPRQLARPARAALAAYGLGLCGLSTRAARRAGAGASDAAALPLVFAVLHLGWGTGFVTSCAREGIPWAALSGTMRRALSGGPESGTAPDTPRD